MTVADHAIAASRPRPLQARTYRWQMLLFASAFYASLILVYNFHLSNEWFTTSIRLFPLDFNQDISGLLAGLLLIAIPLMWFRPHEKPSDVVYVYLFFSVYIPSVLFLMAYPDMTEGRRYLNAFILLACFSVISSVGSVPSPPLSDVKAIRILAKLLLVGAGVFGTAYFLLSSRGSLQGVNLLDVYEQRLDIREAVAAGGGRLDVYLSNIIGLAVAPFLAIWGVRRRSLWLIALGIGVAYVAFAVSSHKTVFFSAIIALTFLGTAMVFGKIWPGARGLPVIVAFTLVAFYNLFTLLIDYLFMETGLLSWYGSFRLFHNNGYLLAVYLDFFQDKPLLLYADSFLSRFIASPFDLPYGRLVGEYITTYAETQNNATAGFLADGYLNLGYAGMFFACFQLWLVLWLANGLARGRDPIFAGCFMISLAITLSNGPVHTALTSNGGMAALLFLAIIPMEQTGGQRSVTR